MWLWKITICLDVYVCSFFILFVHDIAIQWSKMNNNRQLENSTDKVQFVLWKNSRIFWIFNLRIKGSKLLGPKFIDSLNYFRCKVFFSALGGSARPTIYACIIMQVILLKSSSGICQNTNLAKCLLIIIAVCSYIYEKKKSWSFHFSCFYIVEQSSVKFY